MTGKKITRRDFLRTASISAAAVGVGALAGCRGAAPSPAAATAVPAATIRRAPRRRVPPAGAAGRDRTSPPADR